MHRVKFTSMVQVHFPSPGNGKDYENEFLQVFVLKVPKLMCVNILLRQQINEKLFPALFLT